MNGSRLNITFPFIWNNLSGVQPSQRLDDDFNSVPQGSITIGTQVKAASYQLIADDNYSFFLCVPTNNMTLTPPASVITNYSFFFSNQSTSKTVQLITSVTIDGMVFLNPTFPGNFNTLVGVKGGLVVWDGSSWFLYPDLYGPLSGGGGSGLTTGVDAIVSGDTTHVITHSLNNPNAILVGAFSDLNIGQPFITGQAANTITIEFANEAAANGSLYWSVTQ